MKSANLENSSLFDRLKAQTAKEVADYGIENLGKKRVIIPKLLNKLLVFSTRFAPDWLLLKIVAFIQNKK